MPPTRMTVNGLDLSTFGLWVEPPQGFADAPERQDDIVEGRGAGGFIVPSAARIGARAWSFEAVLVAPDLATAQANWDAAKLLMTDVWLEVQLDPWLDRMLICRMQSAQARLQGWCVPGWRVAFSLLAPNPFLVAPLVDSYGLNAGEELQVALGTAPSPFLVRFIGPSVTPTLIYYDANGRVRGSLSLTQSLASGEWLEFNSLTLELIRHADVGTISNGAPLLAQGSQLFALDPLDGTPDASPFLSLDTGAALVYVRKAWR